MILGGSGEGWVGFVGMKHERGVCWSAMAVRLGRFGVWLERRTALALKHEEPWTLIPEQVGDS